MLKLLEAILIGVVVYILFCVMCYLIPSSLLLKCTFALLPFLSRSIKIFFLVCPKLMLHDMLLTVMQLKITKLCFVGDIPEWRSSRLYSSSFIHSFSSRSAGDFPVRSKESWTSKVVKVCVLFVSVLQLKTRGSPNTGWEGSVGQPFPPHLYILSYIQV